MAGFHHAHLHIFGMVFAISNRIRANLIKKGGAVFGPSF
jgi:hypothetical protein